MLLMELKVEPMELKVVMTILIMELVVLLMRPVMKMKTEAMTVMNKSQLNHLHRGSKSSTKIRCSRTGLPAMLHVTAVWNPPRRNRSIKSTRKCCSSKTLTRKNKRMKTS